MPSLVSLMGISTLYRATSTNKTSNAVWSSVLTSYTQSKLAVDRLMQEQEANKAKKSSANVPISAAKDPASAIGTKTSILDTLNSMGLMEEKHTTESVGSILLMVQDAEITSSTAATTDSLNSTKSLGLEEQQHHYQKGEDYATTKIPNTSNVSHTTLMLLSPTEQQLALQHQAQVKATVAYVIIIQDCNLYEPICDGAAVLAHSIIMNSIGFPSSSKMKAPSKSVGCNIRLFISDSQIDMPHNSDILHLIFLIIWFAHYSRNAWSQLQQKLIYISYNNYKPCSFWSD
jgi:hypothetical protein